MCNRQLADGLPERVGRAGVAPGIRVATFAMPLFRAVLARTAAPATPPSARGHAAERSARAAPVARGRLESSQLAAGAGQVPAELSVRRLEANPEGTYLRVSHRLPIMRAWLN